MPAIPRDPLPDATLALLREGYDFIPRRARRYESDVFETRLMGRRTLCMTGADAARVFYDTARFRREGAAPRRLKKTLFGVGGVQGLDDAAHRARKAAFVDLMTPSAIGDLTARFAGEWRAALGRWERQERVELLNEVRPLLARAVCGWTGVPLPDREVAERTRHLGAMIEGSGAVGPRHWKGRLARRRAERWIARLIEKVRAGGLAAPEGRALDVMARFRDKNGDALDPRVAAVEVLNVLRPTVAVARYVVFLAHALHEHPRHRDALRVEGDRGDAGDRGDTARERFVQEVRRLYPFFPLVAAVVRSPFEWRGYAFPEGTRTLLDLYGTGRDGRWWPEPESFRPDRFRDWDGDPFTLIPQGGGDHRVNHRCAGEWVTIEVMKTAADLMTREMTYDVPPQDLSIDRSRIPAIPKSRMVLASVRPAAAA